MAAAESDVEMAARKAPSTAEDNDKDKSERLMMAVKARSQALATAADPNDRFVHRMKFDKFLQHELDAQIIAEDGESIPAPTTATSWEQFKKQGLSKVYADHPSVKGRNRLTPPPERHWILVFIDHQTGMFSLLLWLGAVLCFIAYGLDKTQIDYAYLGAVLAIVVFVTGIFSFYQERKSNAVMEQFNKLQGSQVTVTRDGGKIKIDPVDVCVGDIVALEPGLSVPADLRMITVSNLKVEQSSLTGEPDAIAKNEVDWHENPLESKNLTFFGTSVTEGEGIGIAVMIGDNTIMGNIANMASSGDGRQTPINKEIHRFIKIVSAVAAFLGITFLIVGFALQVYTPIENLVFMIGIIVANVPEGLLATVTVSLTLTAERLRTKAVKVKNLEGVETLGSTTCICSDKTGTLTQNKMTASYMYLNMSSPSEGELPHLYNVRSMTSSKGAEVPDAVPVFKNMQDPALTYILYGANVVNESVFVDTAENLQRPIQERDCTNGNASDFGYTKWAEAMLRKQTGVAVENVGEPCLNLKQRKQMFTLMNVDDVDPTGKEPQPVRIPFNSRYKFMSSVNMVMDPVQQRMRPAVIMKGAAEQIFQRCSHFVDGGDFKPLNDQKVGEFLAVYDKLADDGERLISFCMRYLDDEVAGFDYQPSDLDDVAAKLDHMRDNEKADFLAKLGGVIRSPADYFATQPAATPKTAAEWAEAQKWFDSKGASAPFRKLDNQGDPNLANYPLGSAQYHAWNGVVGKDGVLPQTPAWDGMTFIGVVSLVDPPRDAVPPSILKCHEAGVKVVMVTGDHPQTAEAIARNVNIIRDGAETKRSYAKKAKLIREGKLERTALARYFEMDDVTCNLPAADREKWAEEKNKFAQGDSESIKPENKHKRVVRTHLEARVIPGHELMQMSEEEVQKAFMFRDLVFARTSPEQKLKIVNNAQAMGHVVAVTGDGVNDSPALKGADIGCAMGIAGTDVSKEAADMILLTDDFSAIVTGIEEGRVIFDNLKKSIAYTLSSNIPEISPFIMFILIQMPLSLTTVLILCVDLGTDMIPAISLAYERAESDIMRRPPRDSKEDHLVTAKLVSFSYLQIGVFQALAGFYSFFVVMNDYGFQMGDIPGAALFVMEFPTSKEGKISDECLCGGGAKDKYSGETYAVPIKNGQLDTSSSKYTKLKNKFGGGQVGEDQINKYCPSDKIGTGGSENWPFTWGCKYGGLRPQKKCKFDSDWWSRNWFYGDNPCYKSDEALRHAQTAAFISIVIVQWADLLICKTRILSIYNQGMNNNFMLFGLCSETVLCIMLAYLPFIHPALGTRDVVPFHWMPSFPYSILIFLYDETRKYLIRRHRRQEYPQGPKGPRDGNYKIGWIERYTYY